MQIPRSPGAVSMAPDAMGNLVLLLGQARDGLLDTGRRVADALVPPNVPPAAPDAMVVQVAAQLAPAVHLPVDALDAAGCPAAWTALGPQLDRALQDVHTRAQEWARAGEADAASRSGGLSAGLAGVGAALGRAAAVAPVPSEAERLAYQEGAADADRFATLVWGKKGRCPDFDKVARLLADVRANGAGNPAYAEGFTAAMGQMRSKQYGLDEGNGFERFSRTYEVCRANTGSRQDDDEDRLFRPMGEVFASATNDPNFDIGLAEQILESGLGGGYVFSYAPLRTDVALLVANRWIDEKDWNKGRDPDRIAAGLRVLSANPEAAHLYALEHADTLTNGTNADLFKDPVGGGIFGDAPGPWDAGVAALAADVLRIGLVEYPDRLTATTTGDAAAQAAQAAQHRQPVHGWARLLAALVVAAALSGCRSSTSPPSPADAARQAAKCVTPGSKAKTPYLPSPRSTLERCFNKAMGDAAGRRFLLGAGNAALADFFIRYAGQLGDRLAASQALSLKEAADSPAIRDGVARP